MVDQTRSGWNYVLLWIRQLDSLRRVINTLLADNNTINTEYIRMDKDRKSRVSRT